jgi:hypothetical protein
MTLTVECCGLTMTTIEAWLNHEGEVHRNGVPAVEDADDVLQRDPPAEIRIQHLLDRKGKMK